MKEKTVYVCSSCGNKVGKWMGRCTVCGSFNTFEEETEVVSSGKKTVAKKAAAKSAVRLNEVKTGRNDRIVTGIREFDRVMGGGIVRDSVTIITSPPGGGKSTLALSVCQSAAKQGLNVLYASGEESESQIKRRADRILEKIDENIWITADTCMDNVLEEIKNTKADVVIIDSIQTFALNEMLPSRAGNPVQTMECAGELVKIAKSGSKKTAVIIIGQMNKNDELAGLRSLEHLVDTVLVMDSSYDDGLRSLMATKNRFGSTGEMGFFAMSERGLISIDNPSEYFVTQRDEGEFVSGSAMAVIREGSRPIIAEIESLVSKSYMPYPSRIGEALKREQLNTLISILEQRGGINLFDKNVVIKSTGGIMLREPAVSLAVLISIASSVLEKAVKGKTAFIADVGLTGEIKKVPGLEGRIKELDRMGFDRVFVAKDSVKVKTENIKIVEEKYLKDVIKDAF